MHQAHMGQPISWLSTEKVDLTQESKRAFPSKYTTTQNKQK